MDVVRQWRVRAQHYRLVGEAYPGCKRKIFPPRDVRPHCATGAREPFALSGRGAVYSYSAVYDAPAGYEAQSPYVVAVVELAEGPRVTAQLAEG